MSATIALTKLATVFGLEQDEVITLAISVVLTTLRTGFVPEND